VTLKCRLLTLVVVAFLVFADGAQAAPIVFSGADPGATSTATMPNALAAASAFDAAAALLGSMSLITFESVALGDVNNTTVAPGVLLDDFDNVSAITDTTDGFDLFGGNTTSGGSRYASAFGGQFLFSFTDPIQAFGAFFSGLQGDDVGQETIFYTSGAAQTINIPTMSSGAAFVGFTDAGALISSILVDFEPGFIGDIVGVDDVRYGPAGQQPPVVPEPTSLLLVGTGALGLVRRLRRQKQLR
jgi:hypothetical protein